MVIEGKDLKALIRACKKAGVSELKVGDVHIKFDQTGDAVPVIKAKSEILAPTTAETKAEADKVLLAENVADHDERLAILQLEDPAAFERMIVERELEESGEKTYD